MLFETCNGATKLTASDEFTDREKINFIPKIDILLQTSRYILPSHHEEKEAFSLSKCSPVIQVHQATLVTPLLFIFHLNHHILVWIIRG